MIKVYTRDMCNPTIDYLSFSALAENVWDVSNAMVYFSLLEMFFYIFSFNQ